MGREARANKSNMLRAMSATRLSREANKRLRDANAVKVHIPNSTLDISDALFMGMLRGLRPMTAEERKDAIEQGMDLRPPDIVEAEKQMKKPLIILTDAD